MKQTAVEWLVNNISSNIDNEYFCNQKEITEWVDQAREIEKKQLKMFYQQGDSYSCSCYDSPTDEDFEQYYNENFKK